ncbi:MAG: hypothetical protein II196_08915, partial [Spirochaetales bacterium]|nr:hypothetical protein [Spirochaetales bacterium]
MKKLFLITTIFIFSLFSSYAIRNFGYSTLLLMVEETENDNAMTAAEERYKMLAEYFPQAGLVHGK